jgi:hypothetical protein
MPREPIISDAGPRAIARERPATGGASLPIEGVGRHKLTERGPRILACIREHGEPSLGDPPPGS